ncbi:hypothetical protein L6164_002627 [Bauhinia variegata]|uniref:Uncharacterized protein n=1 Tax=Bauhinia variegata TaxID=167791 RepID=A0ACB9PYS9_BAUVA|nr:hypothetical protein L6164_002627 [Bauhinia variegata]
MVASENFLSRMQCRDSILIDIACEGTLSNKSPAEAYELIEILASNHHQTTSDKEQKWGVLEIGTLDVIIAQNQLLN